MKNFLVVVPAILLVFLLLNSFEFKEKLTGGKTVRGNKSVTGIKLQNKSLHDPSEKIDRVKVESYKSGLKDIVLKSADGGKTWQDISEGLPETEQPVNFFAGESDLYLYVNHVMYRSKTNLKTPVWEKENVPEMESPSSSLSTSIAFNRSNVIAFNYGGKIYRKTPTTNTWLPVHSNFQKQGLRTIFETSDGTVFLSYDHGLYKSSDKGKNWKQVLKGLVMNVVESEGILVATGGQGIMRSTDQGENWGWVIKEGGVGIAVERIKGGFAAISYNSGAKSRRLRISLDNGKTWQAIDAGLRPSLSISSIKQMGKYFIAGHPDGIFRTSDMGKTWENVHPNKDAARFRFQTSWNTTSSDPGKVFRIYVSGDVLYAVAGSSGC